MSFYCRYKYFVLMFVILTATIAVVFTLYIPQINNGADEFRKSYRQNKLLNLAQNRKISSDSLMQEYRSVSTKISDFIKTSISSSDILRMILEKATATNITINGLTTQAESYSLDEVVYPVSFRADGNYIDLLKFIQSMENDALCVKFESIDIRGIDGGKVYAAVKLSVMGLQNE